MKYCDLIKIAIESHMATYQRLLKSPQLGLFERKEYNNVVNACKDCLSIIQDTLNKTPDELNYFIEQHKKNIEYDSKSIDNRGNWGETKEYDSW